MTMYNASFSETKSAKNHFSDSNITPSSPGKKFMKRKIVAIDGVFLRTLSSIGFPICPDMYHDSFV